MYLIHMYLIYLIYGHSYFAFVAISITPVRLTVCVCNSFILQVNPKIMAIKKKKNLRWTSFFIIILGIIYTFSLKTKVSHYV
jgi:hypothetical protein